MSFAEGSAGSSSPEAVALGETLSFFGSVADHAAGLAPGTGERIAAVATGLAHTAGLDANERSALYFAARLRNAGVFGNPAFAKGESLSEREAMIARWDIPAQGARICEQIAVLPKETADIVRWQAECWDGTGYPDQLRWTGIPQIAQLLHIAERYVSAGEPDDAFAAVSVESGRTFAPAQVRTFTMWFHTNGGEPEPVEPPFDSLTPAGTVPRDIVVMLAQQIDRHNGTPERAERIAERGAEIGGALGLADDELRKLFLASLLFGIGELRAAALESAQFDALARLGIETRAAHAMRAAALIETCPYLSDVAPIVRARSEWYDGTGAPQGLRHDAIPRAASILALAIAFDAIDEVNRLETASGTQFDPKSVRALAEVLKARA
jgi:response regulator RpfG family c-di-GMP phosphodiesterase